MLEEGGSFAQQGGRTTPIEERIGSGRNYGKPEPSLNVETDYIDRVTFMKGHWGDSNKSSCQDT